DRAGLTFLNCHYSTGDGSRSGLYGRPGVLRWLFLLCAASPVGFHQLLNLKESLGKIGADRIRTRRADSFLGFGNAARKSPQADNDGQIRESPVQPFAKRASLSNGKRRQGGNAGNDELPSLDLGK